MESDPENSTAGHKLAVVEVMVLGILGVALILLTDKVLTPSCEAVIASPENDCLENTACTNGKCSTGPLAHKETCPNMAKAADGATCWPVATE